MRPLKRVAGGLLEEPAEPFSTSASFLFSSLIGFLAMLFVDAARWFSGEKPPVSVESVLLGGRGVFFVFS